MVTRELVYKLKAQHSDLAVDVLYDLLESAIVSLPKQKRAELERNSTDIVKRLIRVDVVSKMNGAVVSIPLSARGTVSDPSMDAHWQ